MCDNSCNSKNSCCECCACRGRRGPRGHTGPAGTAPATPLQYSLTTFIPLNNELSPVRTIAPAGFAPFIGLRDVAGTQVGNNVEAQQADLTVAFRATRSGTLRRLKFGLYSTSSPQETSPNTIIRVSVFIANAPAAQIAPAPTYIETALRAQVTLPGPVVPANTFFQGENTSAAIPVVDGQYIMVAVYGLGTSEDNRFIGILHAGLLFE